MSLESSASSWDGISFWFVAIGATLAFVGALAGIQARRLNRRLTTEKAETARREKDASDKAIADAGARASEANARAAEANLALARFKAPRSLTDEQQANMIEKLKPFVGVPFDFVVQPEPLALMTQLAKILESAGWKWTAFPSTTGLAVKTAGKPDSGIINFFVGLHVEFDDSRRLEWEIPVNTLLMLLNKAGIEAKGTRVVDGSITPNAVHIIVGTKPS